MTPWRVAFLIFTNDNSIAANGFGNDIFLLML